jgi:hypothetical protein
MFGFLFFRRLLHTELVAVGVVEDVPVRPSSTTGGSEQDATR